MEKQVYVFIDFDDTLSDSVEFSTQYARELSALLSEDNGVDKEVWARTIHEELPNSVNRYADNFRNNPLGGYRAWIAEERRLLAETVFGRVGAKYARSEPIADYARRMEFDALTMCNAAFPGAYDALLACFERGYRVQMASSNESQYLIGALMGAGIESYTESKFGPDLVDCAKEGPVFYTRIFEASGIEPAQAVVVDDQAICLHWAQHAGASVIQARTKAEADPAEFPITIEHLVDLPDLVAGIMKR